MTTPTQRKVTVQFQPSEGDPKPPQHPTSHPVVSTGDYPIRPEALRLQNQILKRARREQNG